MNKYIKLIQALGLIVVFVGMPLFYISIFFNSFFLDVTPVVNVDSHKVDHGANKIWEGMPKAEYEKIKYVEEQKNQYESEEPTFDPNEPSRFNLFEGGNENDKY